MAKMNKKLEEKCDEISKKNTVEGIVTSFCANLKYALSKDQYSATLEDNFRALALTVRDRVVERWINTQQHYHKANVKRVYYLSMEFLIGRLLGNYIFNLGLENKTAQALTELGLNFEEVRQQELDAGLGNGGLGRLAACFLDSMATLGIPGYGYGIRYDYGIFHQKIKDGFQIELPDEWLRRESPWEFARPEYTVRVKFYGRTQMYKDRHGRFCVDWVDTQNILAVPYDYPIPGYKNDVVNTLRLWSARSTEEFDLEYFNQGDYEQAVHEKILSENISKVLYPMDDISQGRELRLKQEYFFVAASIADIIRRFRVKNEDLSKLPDKVTIQLNDTHPILGIVELMRILLDESDFQWEEAWDIVVQIFAYTNHTVMPEALEKWSVARLENLLPRHLQIIYEVNKRFLEEVSQRFPGDEGRIARMSIIEEGDHKRIRMANLAIVGSHSVNGVSELHTELLKTGVFRDFYEFFPKKFNNKTNGITQRRWLLKANTGLSDLIINTIGDKWVIDLSQLSKLIPYKDKAPFRKAWRDIKHENKKKLAEYIARTTEIMIDPESIFDVQVKRMHEYKRQILFGFYIVSQYLLLKHDPKKFVYPRTFLVGGKAAPGYVMAKLTIKFLTSIADMINRDKSIKDKLRMAFLENYRVSLAEKIFPASDVSEQISTAGYEASGTGNMKFMLNGALTIGTLDGANVEISQEVGRDNIFIFGHTAEQVATLKRQGYNPHDSIQKSPLLRDIFHLLRTNFFAPYNPGIFEPIIQSLESDDKFMICADFDSYLAMQQKVSQCYLDQEEWTKKSIVNVAKAGRFSSDRTIAEYAKEIWRVPYHK
ncbi:MAG: glycogen/starch/alpha-glucan phosphorylase [Candidatus Omnitrophica bacterium]|nr:glycogen/starch/alpha-glucan phosphorylase [Candidatus Omnitrophota bacterium]